MAPASTSFQLPSFLHIPSKSFSFHLLNFPNEILPHLSSFIAFPVHIFQFLWFCWMTWMLSVFFIFSYPFLDPMLIYFNVGMFIIVSICLSGNYSKKEVTLVYCGQLLFLSYCMYTSKRSKYQEWQKVSFHFTTSSFMTGTLRWFRVSRQNL